jgi:hypothetical protein
MPFTYQWKKGGVNLTGQTNQTLTLTNCGGGDVATYTVGVSNVAGGVVSSGALLSLFTPTAGTYEALAAGMGPIAYWRLGETSGTTAFDYAGGHDGNYNNVTLSQPGYSGADPNTAVSFGPGTDSYVGNIQNISFAGPGTNASFTLAFWAKGLPTDLIGDGAFICKGTGGGGEQFCIDGYQGRYRFYGGGVSAQGPVAPDGTWQFVVGVCDGPHNRWLLYVNGKLAASAGVPANLVSTAHEVTIGARQAGSTVYDFNWNGLMDEVTILNRALNSQEICALYFKGTGYVGTFEPTLSLITGTGEQGLTNVNFASGDGGFTSDTPSGAPEAAWTYDGSTWYSAGQDTGFGGDNVSYLTSPTNTVTKAGVLKLTFTHRYSFEIGFDGGVVEVSLNGGPWTYIPAVQFDQNGYNGTITEAALGGKRGFVDNSSGHPAYITSSCLLAGANPGDQVNVRFTAAYDNNTTGNLTPPGWQISNVQITQGASGAVSVACPCGNLETKSGDITAGAWQDLGTGSAVISTTKTNQQYFRIQR